MKEKKSQKIETVLSQLSLNEYLTGRQIAEELGVSIKTVRTRIAELNQLIAGNGAQIISKPRYGYQIQVTDQKKWDMYLKSRDMQKELTIGSPEERFAHIALTLLTAADYIKISDFADELYVSPQLISDTLKECEKIFGNYRLSIERKPYYGLRLIGREFDKRNCIISSFPSEYKSFLDIYEDDDAKFRDVVQTLIRTFHAHRIHLAEVSLEKCAEYVYLSAARYSSGFQITDDDTADEEMLKDSAFAAAREIYSRLGGNISESEIYYLGVYISAMRSNDMPEHFSNIVISAKIDRIVNDIFDTIRSVFGISFHDNLYLHMMMAKHLLSLDLRIRYRIPLENSIYLDLRKDFPYAYAIANEAGSVLAREYQVPIDATEYDWLALIFATGLQDLRAARKLNVLVVCQEGAASFRLLKQQIQKNYSGHIANVRVMTAYELNEEEDLSDIDFIFSTVEIRFQTGIPILMVDELALFQKSSALENELQTRRMAVIEQFFNREMFFPCIQGNSKEEVLSALCKKIAQTRKLPEHFLEALLTRERAQPTDYTPNLAIPHPEKLVPDEDIVAVAILEHPVFWGRHNVQVLLLTALTLKREEATQLFYEATSHFITDKKSISALLRTPTYENFISLLAAIDMK